MFNSKNFNFSYIEIFLILSFLICWFSISTSFYDIQNFVKKENNNLNDLINLFRQSLNLSVFPILLGIFFKSFKKIKFRNEFLFVFALSYFLLQIPGLFFSDNSISNLVYVISSCNILLVFALVNIHFDEKKYFIFFYIMLSMLILVTFLNYKTFVNFFISQSSNTLYTFFFSSETFFGKVSPRSTGSSRTLLLILICSFIIFNKYFEKKNFSKIIFFILLSSFILLFQSRTTIVLLFIFVISIFIIEKDYSFKKIIKFFLIYLLLPICFVYLILISKQFFFNEDFLPNLSKFGFKENLIVITDDFKRPIDPETYSSGRLDDWKSLLSKINTSIILGYGAQGDRFLINQTASNGILYSLSSSGILGTLFFLLFSLLSLRILLKNFLNSLHLGLIVSYYSSIVVFVILLRSILESSYAVFSIDFIVIYTFINYLNKFSLKNKDGN